MASLPHSRHFRFTPVKTWMSVAQMLRLVITQLKILNRIVRFVPVDVMHDFCRRQLTTKRLSHHVAVFSDVMSIDANVDVTSRVGVSPSFP